MKIQYRFDIEDTALEYEVDVDRTFDFRAEREDAPEWAKVNGVDKVSDERWCERAYNVVICEGRLHEPGRDRPVQTMYMRNFQEVFGLDCGDASPDELHRRAGECEQVNGAW